MKSKKATGPFFKVKRFIEEGFSAEIELEDENKQAIQLNNFNLEATENFLIGTHADTHLIVDKAPY